MDFNKIKEAVMGYKSYGVLALIALVGGLGSEGYLHPETVELALGVLIPLLGATTAAKLNRLVTAIQSSTKE